jgi:hypothetical protein
MFVSFLTKGSKSNFSTIPVATFNYYIGLKALKNSIIINLSNSIRLAASNKCFSAL